jgi:hypothetical protein
MRVEKLNAETKKRALIERLSADKTELAVYFDEEPNGAFACRVVEPGLIVIIPPYDFDALDRWWYYGNWQAIAPVDPGYEPFDTFRSTDAQIERKLEMHKVSIIIDSFHDDTEWKVIER